MTIALWACAAARADVYRCENPELGVVYQQTPCDEPESENTEDAAPPASPEPADTGDTAERPVVGRHQSVAEVVAEQQELQRRNQEVVACKQQYRDAIDGIDLEIRNSYTPEQREYYLGRLKALTDQMKECEAPSQ